MNSIENNQGELNGIQAAYALNLCTVSVSQIIDYDDINILEQEYETILNNLNLQNMPDDDALLHILKQLLDTVSFFRIQEGDKAMIEREYKHKIKNAIWDAVPNMGVVLASGNWIAMAVSLACQIGTGYMNYRKAKSTYKLDREKQYWKLQRTAMEQFHGLRRELFDTAWRLAKKYSFADCYRLTERQITQYDSILMDPDVVRKYQRLEAVQENFLAYPPFWYYIGNAANQISRDTELSSSTAIKEKYGELAVSHFNRYWQTNRFGLLREDHIASSCALEYADILAERKVPINDINQYLNKAVTYSGNSCDILQLCAIGFLKTGTLDRAQKILKYLVNEGYNTSVNAQLLSGVLINRFQSGKLDHDEIVAVKAEYDVLLSRRDQSVYLIPWPENGITQEETFMNSQRELILKKFQYIVDILGEEITVTLNQAFPVPNIKKEYNKFFYTDHGTENRIEEIKSVFSIEEKKREYLYGLRSVRFALDFIDVYNELLTRLQEWEFLDTDKLVSLVKERISEKKDVIENLQFKMQQETFNTEDFITLQSLTGKAFSDPFWTEIMKQICLFTGSLKDMRTISDAESMIYRFCDHNNIPQPEMLMGASDVTVDSNDEKIMISYEILGEGTKDEILEKEKIIRLRESVSAETIRFIRPERAKLITYDQQTFEEFFANKKMRRLLQFKDETIIILQTGGDIWLFTMAGIVYFAKDDIVTVTTYEHFRISLEHGCIIVNTVNYEEEYLLGQKLVDEENLKKLYNLLCRIKHMILDMEE